MDADVYTHFGFARGDPFLRGRRFDWTGLRRIANRLRRAVRHREWVLFFGPPGAGKTEALNEFAEAHEDDYWVARVLANDREMVGMNTIHHALIEDLNLADLEARVPRRREARMRQIVRLLGVRSEEKPVLLVMDEASHFCLPVLDDVKFLRDQLWRGRRDKADRRPHFAVAMFGWASLAKRVAASRQNRIRVQRHEVPPMSQAELEGFVAHVGMRRVVPAEARRTLWQVARYPGEVRYALLEAMERAMVRGSRVVRPEDLLAGAGGVGEALRTRGIRWREVAQAAKASEATVSLVLRDAYTGQDRMQARVLLEARRLIAEHDTGERAKKPYRRRDAAARQTA